jgi:hypothetical protein
MNVWGRICDDIWIWNYNTNFRYYDLPFANLRVISSNIRYFALALTKLDPLALARGNPFDRWRMGFPFQGGMFLVPRREIPRRQTAR